MHIRYKIIDYRKNYRIIEIIDYRLQMKVIDRFTYSAMKEMVQTRDLLLHNIQSFG